MVAPSSFAKRNDGAMRMCVDYRAVNQLTVKNSYPLPRIDDLLDRLHGAKVFSCLDLHQAYHQVRLHADDIPKTAFTMPMGLFEYMVLPFGSGQPATLPTSVPSTGRKRKHWDMQGMLDQANAMRWSSGSGHAAAQATKEPPLATGVLPMSPASQTNPGLSKACCTHAWHSGSCPPEGSH